jgi:hypothetical protein
MIVQDLLMYDSGKPFLIEGAALLPESIHNENVNPKRVLYLVPTKEFQIHHYKQRGFIHHILKDCADPEKAFENWMMRDHLFGKEIQQQAEAYGFGSILVDGKRGIKSQFKIVMEYYGLP